ncbi:MAG: hypothetical protein ACI4R9_05820 [Kiritimatiellia bacterium]
MKIAKVLAGLGVAFAVVSGVSAAERPVAAIGPHGALDVGETHLAPCLFDADWQPCAVTGGWSDAEGASDETWRVRTFAIVDGRKQPIVRGRFRYSPQLDASGTVKLDWRFDVVRDFDGKGLCLVWRLPCRSFATPEGRVSVADGDTCDGWRLPVSPDRPCIGSRPGGKVEVACADAHFTITLATPTPILVQDDRIWNGDGFSLRLSVGKGALKAGETRTLSFVLAGVDALEGAPPRIGLDGDGAAAWVPLRDTTEIKAGSALDFSRQGWIEAPAGQYGRVVVEGSHFAFEQKPGVAQRFYGVNLCFTANYLSEAMADELCTRLTRLGYNALRIHHYERALCDEKDGTTIRPEKMAQLDNLLNACIRHGIYLTTDLFVSRRVPWRVCGIDRDGIVPMDEFKELVLFHEGAYRNYLAFSRAFLGHVNPKTGRRWADEPALAFLALVNEGNPGNRGYSFMARLPESKAAWETWLAEKKSADPATYADITTAVPKDCWENSRQNSAYCLFLTEVEIAFAEKMKRFIREEIGSPVLLTDLSCWKNPIHYQLARTRYDYVDDHFYVDHPSFPEERWRQPSVCPNANPVRGANAGFESVFKHRLLDKPFTLTEFNYSGPGRYRGVGGMMLGAQAALQEYDAIWRFAWSHSDDAVLDSRPMSYFDVARDPLQRATERAVMTLFMRRDMPPLSRSFAIVLPERGLRTEFDCGPQADIRDNWYGWYAKLGTWVGEGKPAWATAARAFPSVYSMGTDDFRTLAGAAKPGDGHVVLDRATGLFGVDTPMTRGFFSECPKAGTRVAIGGLSARLSGVPYSGELPAAALWISALDGKPLDDSRRMLLTHVADVQDTGMTYADARMKVLLAWGRLPHLMRRAEAEVTLAFAPSCRVYALAADGTRRDEVQVEADGNGVRFTVDTGRDPTDATSFYEIVR